MTCPGCGTPLIPQRVWDAATIPAPKVVPDAQCHEDVTRKGFSEPCNRPPVGYRLDEGDPYPVCRKHHRPPYWLTARAEASRVVFSIPRNLADLEEDR